MNTGDVLFLLIVLKQASFLLSPHSWRCILETEASITCRKREERRLNLLIHCPKPSNRLFICVSCGSDTTWTLSVPLVIAEFQLRWLEVASYSHWFTKWVSSSNLKQCLVIECFVISAFYRPCSRQDCCTFIGFAGQRCSVSEREAEVAYPCYFGWEVASITGFHTHIHT